MVWEHVNNGQVATWHEQAFLELAKCMVKGCVYGICGSGGLRPVVGTSAIRSMQRIAKRQELVVFVSGSLRFADVLLFQHVHGDQGDVPSTGVTIHGCMLQSLCGVEMRSAHDAVDLALHFAS